MRIIHSIHIGSKRTVATLGAALAALALFGLLTVAGSAGAQSQQQPADTPTPAPTHTPTPDLGGTQASKPQGTLDSMLSQLVESVERGFMTTHSAASDAPLHHNGSIAVTFYTDGGNAALARFLRQNGGDPRNIGADYIETYVPIDLLAAASQQPGVVSVRAIIPPQPAQAAQGAVVSQGVSAHNADAWHAARYRGAGVSIGIIDPGFMGLSDLMGSEAPSNITARCYRSIGSASSDIADCEIASSHGTALVETIVDVAPEAALYISNPNSFGDLRASVDWMVAQGVDVINYSAGWTWDGPGDGTSPFMDSPLRSVDAAVDGGIMWASSAGNNAMKTWYAEFSNPDSDDWLNFNANDERNDVYLEAGKRFIVQLRWEDRWPYASRDLDMYMFDYWGRPVARSQNFQLGHRAHTPYEVFAFTPRYSGTYSLGITHVLGGAPRWVQLQAFSGETLQYHTLNGSIANPAESANAGLLAVGAAHWADTNTIEPFSSRGPAPDGRSKPEIVGADCGAAVSRGEFEHPAGQRCWVMGTSQATAHVSGLAALVRQAFPDYTPQQTADYLKRTAEARGIAPNNTWGYGFAKLPDPSDLAPPPAVTATPTRVSGSATPTATPSATPVGGGGTQPTPSAGFTAVSNGPSHACGIRRVDGTIACWGSNAFGQGAPPSGSGFTAISSGDAHTCALDGGGAISCWGNGAFGLTTPPSGGGFTAISSGANHTCALHSNGAISCWGNSAYGQATAPSGNRFTSVSSSDTNTCALRNDGAVVCWGSVSGAFTN